MPLAKKSKSAAVRVETKKMSGDCCGMGGMCGMKGICHLFLGLLLIVNLVITIIFFCSYTRTEAMKVGGFANYKMVKQIYKTDAFKAGQKQQIESALQMYQGGGAATATQNQANAQPVAPTTTP